MDKITTLTLAVAVLCHGLLLALWAALGELEWDYQPLTAEGSIEGPGRVFAAIFALPLIFFALGTFTAILPLTNLQLLALTEAGTLGVVACADGKFGVLKQRIATSELHWIARALLAFYAILILLLSLATKGTGLVTALPLYLLLVAGLFFLFIAADEIEILGAELPVQNLSASGRVYFACIAGMLTIGAFATLASNANATDYQPPRAPSTTASATPRTRPTPVARRPVALNRCPCGYERQGDGCVSMAPPDYARPAKCKSPWFYKYSAERDSGLEIRPQEHFRLHLAGILLGDGADTCSTVEGRNLQLCITSSAGEQCLSQGDACTDNPACSNESVLISGADLVNGLSAEIRRAGSTPLAFTVQYGGVMRSAVCISSIFRTSSGVGFTYFLEPVDG